jgi:hypothetical protein
VSSPPDKAAYVSVRIPAADHATWRRLAIELAPAVGRMLTMADVATALTATGAANTEAMISHLKGPE